MIVWAVFVPIVFLSTFTLVVMRAVGLIDWPWLFVASPVWGTWAVLIVAVLVVGVWQLLFYEEEK